MPSETGSFFIGYICPKKAETPQRRNMSALGAYAKNQKVKKSKNQEFDSFSKLNIIVI